MKKIVILFLIGLVVTSFSSVSALDLKGKFAVNGNGGLAIPIGDFADKEKGAAKTGFGFYPAVEYYVTNNIAVGGFLAYFSFGSDNEAWKDKIPADDADITQKGLGFGAFGKYLFDVHEKVAPYAKVGGGVFKPKFSGTVKISEVGFDGDVEGDYDYKALVMGGGGVLYLVSPNVGLNFEAMLLHGMTKDGKGEVTVGDMEPEDDKITFDMQGIELFAGVYVFFGPK